MSVINALCDITEATLAECRSCGWIGHCELTKENMWQFPLHKRLMAQDEKLPLPDRITCIFHDVPGYARMASAADAEAYQIPSWQYCHHWEITQARQRPVGFRYWTDNISEVVQNIKQSTLW